MAVYVDKPHVVFRGQQWCHMIADTLEELHEMADKIGLKRSWYQRRSQPHYDISPNMRNRALKEGAIFLEREGYVKKLREIRKSQLEQEFNVTGLPDWSEK